MRSKIIIALAAAFLSSASHAGSAKTYWFLLKEKEQRWCGFADEKAFQSAVAGTWSLETARVRYEQGKMSSLVYQTDAESGDWRFIDEYVFLADRIVLDRMFLRVGPAVTVRQKAVIGGRRPIALHTVQISADDKWIDGAASADMPDLPIAKSIEQFRFLKIVPVLQRGVPTECMAGE